MSSDAGLSWADDELSAFETLMWRAEATRP